MLNNKPLDAISTIDSCLIMFSYCIGLLLYVKINVAMIIIIENIIGAIYLFFIFKVVC